jgi:hypothetical protein
MSCAINSVSHRLCLAPQAGHAAEQMRVFVTVNRKSPFDGETVVRLWADVLGS